MDLTKYFPEGNNLEQNKPKDTSDLINEMQSQGLQINHLQKTKEALLNTDRNLKIANDKAKDINIKKLTKNNATMAKKFLDIKKNK